MQKVACPITIVQSERSIPPVTKNEFSAIPVMIPGSAIGSTTTNETSSRPKKRKRWTAKAAAVPSRRAMPIAARPALTESQRAAQTRQLAHPDARDRGITHLKRRQDHGRQPDVGEDDPHRPERVADADSRQPDLGERPVEDTVGLEDQPPRVDAGQVARPE